MRRITSTAIIALLVAASLAGTAGPAAADIWEEGWDWRTLSRQGVYERGTFDVEAWVDVDTGTGYRAQRVRAHGYVVKDPWAPPVRVQIDEVKLGYVPVDGGGVMATNGADRNSGAGASAESATAWVNVTEDCGAPRRMWAKVTWSARWRDGGLSRGTFYSEPTYSYVCRR